MMFTSYMGKTYPRLHKALNLHRQNAIYRLNQVCDIMGICFEDLPKTSRF